MAKNQTITDYIKRLIGVKSASQLKKFNSTDAFLHHVKKKRGTPQPVEIIDGTKFWDKNQIEAWTPERVPGVKKLTTKGD